MFKMDHSLEAHNFHKELLDRYCAIDTSDWGENEFFHFLEKPWKSQYEPSKQKEESAEISRKEEL